MVLYDGVCNLCNGWVNFVIDRDAQSRYKFASLQGEAGRALMARVGRSELVCFVFDVCARTFLYAWIFFYERSCIAVNTLAFD